MGGGTEPLGGSVALHAIAWHRASRQWTSKCKGGGERSGTCVLASLVKCCCLMMWRLHRGRLIMAFRDVSDKLYPEERVELQRWHCATPIKAYLQVTASGPAFNVLLCERQQSKEAFRSVSLAVNVCALVSARARACVSETVRQRERGKGMRWFIEGVDGCVFACGGHSTREKDKCEMTLQRKHNCIDLLSHPTRPYEIHRNR